MLVLLNNNLFRLFTERDNNHLIYKSTDKNITGFCNTNKTDALNKKYHLKKNGKDKVKKKHKVI